MAKKIIEKGMIEKLKDFIGELAAEIGLDDAQDVRKEVVSAIPEQDVYVKLTAEWVCPLCGKHQETTFSIDDGAELTACVECHLKVTLRAQ